MGELSGSTLMAASTLTFPYWQAIRRTAAPVADGILAFAQPGDRKTTTGFLPHTGIE